MKLKLTTQQLGGLLEKIVNIVEDKNIICKTSINNLESFGLKNISIYRKNECGVRIF